jgi:SH3 domain-containing protein
MSLRGLALAIGTAVALALPGTALASYTTNWVNLRVGPSLDYGVLIVVPAGIPVDIHGCVPGWCRVWYHGFNGWLSAAYLSPPPYVYAPGLNYYPPPPVVYPPFSNPYPSTPYLDPNWHPPNDFTYMN